MVICYIVVALNINCNSVKDFKDTKKLLKMKIPRSLDQVFFSDNPSKNILKPVDKND